MLHAAKCRQIAYEVLDASWESILRAIEEAARHGHLCYTHHVPLNGDQVRALTARGFEVKDSATVSWGQADPPSASDSVPISYASGFRAALDRYESEVLRRALVEHGGNVAETARILGLNRTTLVEKLKKHSIKTSNLTAAQTLLG